MYLCILRRLSQSVVPPNQPLFERTMEICMNENICPIDFDQDIECVLAPNLRFKGLKLCSIPVENIIGFNLIKPCNDEKVVMIYPTPIVVESNNLFTIIQSDKYWEPDLINVVGSHILCMVIVDDLPEMKLQQILSVVNLIHGNRTVMLRSELYKLVEKSQLIQDGIKDAYNVEGDIFSHKSGLSSILINNGYKKAPQKRRKLNTASSDNFQEKKWAQFASLNHGVMTFDEIIKALNSESPERVKAKLVKLMSEDENLHNVWQKVSNGLAKVATHE